MWITYKLSIHKYMSACVCGPMSVPHPIVCVCVLVCMCVYACTCTYVCVCVCAVQGSTLVVIPQFSYILLLLLLLFSEKTHILSKNLPSRQGWLASKPRACLCPPSGELINACPQASLHFIWVLGIP